MARDDETKTDPKAACEMDRKTDHELLEFVDEHDRVVGLATRREIHARGLMHRSVHIFVYNSKGEIYVQRRSSIKDRFPDRLDSSAAGHVDPGESYHDAAIRELKEELRINAEVEELLRVTPSPVTDNEHVVLYKACSDAAPDPDPDEVQWGTYLTPQALTRLMETQPHDFVPAFIHLWKLARVQAS